MRNLILMACLLLPTVVSAQPAATGLIDGWIVDAAGSSIDGVYVSVSDGKTVVAKTITHDAGRFRAELPAGFYAVTAELQGFRRTTVNIRIEPKQTAEIPILLRLGRFGDSFLRTVEGRVIDAQGRAVRTAHVTAVLPTAGHEDGSSAATTDAEGRFRLPVDPMDTLIIVAMAEGQMGAAVLPSFGFKTPSPIEIKLQPLTRR